MRPERLPTDQAFFIGRVPRTPRPDWYSSTSGSQDRQSIDSSKARLQCIILLWYYNSPDVGRARPDPRASVSH
jgi:hypothetical protein